MFFLFSNCVFAQDNFSSNQLKGFLDKAEQATATYSETFKNLIAEENKTFEDYDKKGKLEAVRKIKSVFIVYQSPKNGEVNEFRNVQEFNGKNVALADEEIERLFEKLSTAESVADQWQSIINRGVRYDGKSSAWGMTLWQESPLGKLRPFFEFDIAGKDSIDGRDVVVIEYKQTKPTLLIKFNPTKEDWLKEPNGREYHAPLSSYFFPANPEIVGKFWLDAETAQIWRNEFKIIIAPAQLSKPLVAMEVICEYQPSEFKILVPKRFVYSFNKISGTGDRDLSITKDRMMLFEYSKFSVYRSEAKDYKIADN
jgi:hypothetical protein